ncbi:MAG: integrase, partial [Alphaproteobacteria bacterium]
LKGATRIRRSLRRPLSDEAADLLRAWRIASPISPAGWVFPNTEDANNPRPDLKKIWDRVCSRAELTDVRVHDLRHSFASAAVNAGASLHVVGKALGHADVRTTERYAHVMDSSIRDVANAVSRVLR